MPGVGALVERVGGYRRPAVGDATGQVSTAGAWVGRLGAGRGSGVGEL
jgi:hypothetical protein